MCGACVRCVHTRWRWVHQRCKGCVVHATVQSRAREPAARGGPLLWMLLTPDSCPRPSHHLFTPVCHTPDALYYGRLSPHNPVQPSTKGNQGSSSPHRPPPPQQKTSPCPDWTPHHTRITVPGIARQRPPLHHAIEVTVHKTLLVLRLNLLDLTFLHSNHHADRRGLL